MASIASDLNSIHSGCTDPDDVYLNRHEYDRLIRISHQYASLRENLVKGGVSDDTVTLLSHVVAGEENQTQPQRPLETADTESVTSLTSQLPRTRLQAHKDPVTGQWTLDQASNTMAWTKTEEPCEYEDRRTDAPSFYGDGQENLAPKCNRFVQERDSGFVREATRTILISNLPEGATHADITAAVRGGQLLDVYLLYKNNRASVSFIHDEDAYAFFEHCRRHDLYVKQKRVEVFWNDRQFTLSNHIAHKLSIGATRNLVIRRCRQDQKQEDIRQDLEHIHNLVVVNIRFIGNNCFISTNSVACAGFARICMMSRLKYKGSRIEFDLDECAQALTAPPPRRHRATAGPLKQTAASVTNSMENRFNVLCMDD